MQRILLQGILDRIAAELPQFKTVDIYNDQFTKQDAGSIDSFRFPALFISFPDGADYNEKTAGVQQSTDLTVRFYIADELTKSRLGLNKTVLEIMDLKQAVFTKFQGFSVPYIQTFTRIFEETDEDRTNYYIFVQDYKTGVIDAANYVDQGTEVTLGLDLTPELIINPTTDDDIRTARDVNDN
jgi:hypothetical protein